MSEFPPSLQVVPWRAEAFVVVALCAALEVQMSVNGCRAVAARGIGSNVSVSVIFQCAVTQCAVIQCAVTQLLNLSLQYAITQSVIFTWATQRLVPLGVQ